MRAPPPHLHRASELRENCAMRPTRSGQRTTILVRMRRGQASIVTKNVQWKSESQTAIDCHRQITTVTRSVSRSVGTSLSGRASRRDSGLQCHRFREARRIIRTSPMPLGRPALWTWSERGPARFRTAAARGRESRQALPEIHPRVSSPATAERRKGAVQGDSRVNFILFSQFAD